MQGYSLAKNGALVSDRSLINLEAIIILVSEVPAARVSVPRLAACTRLGDLASHFLHSCCTTLLCYRSLAAD